MTVSSPTNRISYNGDGTTTVFSVPFLFLANADITAILRAADDTETTWVEGTDYTLAGAGDPSGGTLTATTAPATSETLVIKRVVSLTQETDYPEGGEFPAQAHEDALDRGTMADQQLQEQIDRAVKMGATSAFKNIEFPDGEPNKPIAWDPTGTRLILLDKIDEFGAVGGNLLVDSFVDGVDYTSGTTTVLTLTIAPATKNNLFVQFDGVTQHHSTYSLVGAVLTFDTAIPFGTANVEVQYGVSLAINTPADGAVSTVKIADNAVTLAKLAHGTAGKFIGFDGSGVPVELAGGGLGDLLSANNLSDLADIPTARGNLGLGDLALENAPLAVAKGGTEAATAAAARTNLGLAIGFDVQAFDADIDTLAQPAFSVHKGGANQTSVAADTDTKVTWPTEIYDTNSDFASDRFTPTVAGKYLLTASYVYTAGDADDPTIIYIYKNGSSFKRRAQRKVAASAQEAISISVMVDANGSGDYYEVFARHSTTGGLTILGAATDTWFMGMRIGP